MRKPKGVKPGGINPKSYAKTTGAQMLPSRGAVAKLVGGTPAQRSLNNYAKQTPLDLSGKKNAGQNILAKKTPLGDKL